MGGAHQAKIIFWSVTKCDETKGFSQLPCKIPRSLSYDIEHIMQASAAILATANHASL